MINEESVLLNVLVCVHTCTHTLVDPLFSGSNNHYQTCAPPAMTAKTSSRISENKDCLSVTVI